MNIEVRQPVHGAKDSGKARVGIFDCDIHPKSSLEDLRPYLSNRWWDYLQTYGQASVVIPYENGGMSRAEIRERAGDRRFAHVLFLSRTSELLGASGVIGRSSKRRSKPAFRSVFTCSARAAVP